MILEDAIVFDVDPSCADAAIAAPELSEMLAARTTTPLEKAEDVVRARIAAFFSPISHFRIDCPRTAGLALKWPDHMDASEMPKGRRLNCGPLAFYEMERAKRFELSTLTLARLCSTPELRPQPFREA
jgi:hypothetical protein